MAINWDAESTELDHFNAEYAAELAAEIATQYRIIEKHTWQGTIAGYEVRHVNAPLDTASDCLTYVATQEQAETFISRQTA